MGPSHARTSSGGGGNKRSKRVSEMHVNEGLKSFALSERRPRGIGDFLCLQY